MIKLIIYTGVINGMRFFDEYLNEECDSCFSEYVDDDRYDFILSEDDMESRKRRLASDNEILTDCLYGLSIHDRNAVLRSVYRNSLERELLAEHVDANLKKMAIEEWVNDCLEEVKQKYNK